MHHLLPGWLTPTLWTGVLFVCVLPSTVRCSIAFASIGRGNVPAAVCSATASNLLGILVAPVLFGLVLSHQGRGKSGGVLDIVALLLLPFVPGQPMQPLIGGWTRRNRTLLGLTDPGSVLIVVWAAFSEAVLQGSWRKVPPSQPAMVLLVDAVLLAAVLPLTRFRSRLFGFDRTDEVAIVFCGSKKMLASGVPMAGVLCPVAAVGQVLLLMIFHQLPLFVCARLARGYARRADAVSIRS